MLLKLIKNKFFWISLVVFISSGLITFSSQTFLYNKMCNGEIYASLHDLILDNIPYYNCGWVYDYCIFLAIFLFLGFIVFKKKYNLIPYFLLLIGIFNLIRGIFIVLTPIGNPPGFAGVSSRFNGFSKYDIGVYPSGHVGSTFLYVLFSNGIFRWLIFITNLIIVVTLALARGHYSIDILSGFIFSYAIFCFGEKYLKKYFMIKE